jgi:hypothetical protein
VVGYGGGGANKTNLLTLAWYYPRNTVIPVVIPQKELFMPTGLLTMLRSYRHIRRHNQQRKRIGFYLWSKGQPLVLSWKSQSSIPTETIFAKKRQRIFFFLFSLLFLFMSQTLSTHPSLLSLLRVSQATTTHQTLGAREPYPPPPHLPHFGVCWLMLSPSCPSSTH